MQAMHKASSGKRNPAQASATQRRQAQASSGNAQNPVKPGLQTQKKPLRAFAKA